MRSPMVISKKVDELGESIARLTREFNFLRTQSSTSAEHLVSVQDQIFGLSQQRTTLQWVLKQRATL